MDDTQGRGLAAPLLLVVASAALLRFVNLGYSHFQGDEVIALLPDDVDLPSLPSFLLSQMKGPGQFLVTGAVRTVSGHYTEMTTRIPFAMASLAVVAMSFLLARRILGQGPALLAAALIGTCGLIVGLGRISRSACSWCCSRRGPRSHSRSAAHPGCFMPLRRRSLAACSSTMMR